MLYRRLWINHVTTNLCNYMDKPQQERVVFGADGWKQTGHSHSGCFRQCVVQYDRNLVKPPNITLSLEQTTVQENETKQNGKAFLFKNVLTDLQVTLHFIKTQKLFASSEAFVAIRKLRLFATLFINAPKSLKGLLMFLHYIFPHLDSST